jgi:hypothetical protein
MSSLKFGLILLSVSISIFNSSSLPSVVSWISVICSYDLDYVSLRCSEQTRIEDDFACLMDLVREPTITSELSDSSK